MGMFVTEFLNENFISSFMDYSFTAKTENQLDQIAFNGKNWNDMLKEFYSGFSDLSNKVPEERYQLEKDLGEYEGKNLKQELLSLVLLYKLEKRRTVMKVFPNIAIYHTIN